MARKSAAEVAARSTRGSRWTYSKCEFEGKPAYEVKAGAEIIAIVPTEGDADMLCRMKVEAGRLAFDVRRHLMKIRALSNENRMLLAALRRVAVTMQRSSSPDLASAKNEVNRILRQMRMRGGA